MINIIIAKLVLKYYFNTRILKKQCPGMKELQILYSILFS